MRKCPSCGYLLFAETDTCGHCGAPVAAKVTAAVSGVTAATGAGLPDASLWTPSSMPPPPAPTPPPRPTTRTPAADGRQWIPAPEPVAPKRSALPRAVVAIIASLVLTCAVGAGALAFLRSDSLPAGTAAFVAGHGVEYTAPDGSFSARFPRQPVAEAKPISVSGVSLTLNYASDTTSDYEMGAASMVLPVAVPASEIDRTLQDALNSGLAGADGKLTRSERTTRGGLPAIYGDFSAPDGYSARMLVALDKNKVFVLFAHAKSGTPKLFDALDKSFTEM